METAMVAVLEEVVLVTGKVIVFTSSIFLFDHSAISAWWYIANSFYFSGFGGYGGLGSGFGSFGGLGNSFGKQSA